MDQQLLSSRAIIGRYFARLETNPGLAWVDAVSNLFTSDQRVEEYAFLGQSPKMREWVGGRQLKGLTVNSFSIKNIHYEAALEIDRRDARLDKTGQIMARVDEFADRALTHWASLLSTLLMNATSTACYDGQFFFDTDHSEDYSGSQSNDITVDISALPAAVHGVVTAPSVEEIQQAILKGIAQILSFKDNTGEPMNENAQEFTVIVPTSLYLVAAAAVSAITTTSLQQNLNANVIAGMKVNIQMNPRLIWTDSFAVFRTDSPVKGFIRQSEQDLELNVIGEGSEHTIKNKTWLFTVDTWRNVGYGYWQRACYVTMT